ncbi:MAG: integration host factor subunit beta [Phycisphaerales bacterium]|nr:MAG: integration host factor subunit beta [Phycisphaerales bacterium]
MATVTKRYLVDRIADSTGATKTLAKGIVRQLIDEIMAELAKGNRIELRDFGIFEPKTRSARRAKNPRTMETVRVPARRTIKFKAGRLMKEKLNGQVSD